MQIRLQPGVVQPTAAGSRRNLLRAGQAGSGGVSAVQRQGPALEDRAPQVAFGSVRLRAVGSALRCLGEGTAEQCTLNCLFGHTVSQTHPTVGGELACCRRRSS